MPIYKITCTACHFSDNQYLTGEFGSKVVPCPGCGRGALARKVKTKGIVEGEADGVVGLLRYDNKRHSNR